MTWDHPRVCGEHTTMATWFIPLPGSSPRMRGTRSARNAFITRAGIIPAYAGNTTWGVGGFNNTWDHPRVCGEHRHIESFARKLPGSSPRMRGTLWFWFAPWKPFGIIPAYAGNTIRISPKPQTSRDHPRVCGEHYVFRMYVRFSPGSSPRMRGTPSSVSWRACVSGIIPAYAGNTWCRTCCLPWIRDHPRVCGEHAYGWNGYVDNMGSSPRMRGTPELQRHHRRNFGIIPAYAGNTKSVSVGSSCGWDHPRVCGEH